MIAYYDTQAFNPYAYVRNNPLKYTDPSGHSWWTDFRDKWLKPALAIVAAVVVAIYAPQFLSTYMGIAEGTMTSVVATGAMAGAASGAVMTGTIEGTLKGAMFGALSAGTAYTIGGAFGHAGSIFSKQVKVSQAFIKATVHGITRGAISMVQGGTFRAGFASGFSASFFSPGTELGGKGAGGFTLRTGISAIVGGTAAEIGGGKFANGAVGAAFVHMFNAEGMVKNTTMAVKKYFTGNGEMVRLDNGTKNALRTHPLVTRQINALKNGTAKYLNGNLSVDLTDKMFHVGQTGVVFNTVCSQNLCTTGFVGFVNTDGFSTAISPDGFVDPINIGVEFWGGTPYLYIPYSWSVTYDNKF